jgi:hypothetical protein
VHISEEIRRAIERANSVIKEFKELELTLRVQIETMAETNSSREMVILAKWIDTNRLLLISKRPEYETALKISKAQSQEVITIMTLIREIKATQEQEEHDRRISINGTTDRK